ncbi:CG0192-related protein [Arthrobacter sp. SA17]
MAIVQRATLTPSKMALLRRWLPNQSWFKGNMGTDLARVGSFRFDDPDGEVGIETLLVAKNDGVFQVPLTYRGSRLPGADSYLIGTMEHSVLGTRWIYDAAGDPVYAAALATTIVEGRKQASQCFEIDGRLDVMPESVQLQSAGIHGCVTPAVQPAVAAVADGLTTIRTGNLELSVTRALNLGEAPSGGSILTATWEGRAPP